MITYLQRKIASWADERILLMGEIINGIRVIKMYTWEGPFENLVSMLRKYLKFYFDYIREELMKIKIFFLQF